MAVRSRGSRRRRSLSLLLHSRVTELCVCNELPKRFNSGVSECGDGDKLLGRHVQIIYDAQATVFRFEVSIG